MKLAKRIVERKGHGMAPVDIFRAAASDDTDTLRAAIEQGVPVNSLDGNGMTPLHYAAANLSRNAIDFLLKVPGLDGTIVDNFGRTASFAAIEVNGEAGADVAEVLRETCYPQILGEAKARLDGSKPEPI